MNKIRLALNIMDSRINIIIDKDTGIRFSKNEPIKTVDSLSEGIKNSIKFGSIIDIDNVSGIEVSDKLKKQHQLVLNYFGIKKIEPKEEETIIEEVVEKEIKQDKSKKGKKQD